MRKSEKTLKRHLNLPSIGVIVAVVTLTAFIVRLDSKVENLSDNLAGLSNDVVGLSNDVAGLSGDFVSLSNTVASLSDELKESNIRQDLQIMKTNERLTNLVIVLVDTGVVRAEPKLFTELQNAEPTLNDEKTRLHFAAFEGDVEAIPDLLNEGAVINARDEDDETPLHYAARKGRAIAIATLLDAGADPNLRDEKGRMPIDIIKENSPLYHTPIWERLNDARSDS